ncbi:maleylacetoacetate isomerase maia [Microthyrium microscopicum]|uniref:Maleylacetoacetate isomerase maia n=1 Tax=Microthyrium microscopicum TaxID=703497 RepID=A0A6A6U9I3_9PEZI|nr:maleylacetoacetate isomerase maia [Microthyrium microscopicum]
MSLNPSSTNLTLYHFYRSSSSSRLRIALAHRKIPYHKISINLLTKAHHEAAYAAINPSMTVPTLIAPPPDPKEKPIIITQSFAALEYLEETHTTNPLLPKDPGARATVRTLTNLIVAENQATTSMRLVARVKRLAGEKAELEWLQDFTRSAFNAYETIAAPSAGLYSVGDEMTMADVCLAPAIWNAVEKANLSIDEWPTIARVFRNLMAVDAVREGGWWNQEDCPADAAKEGRARWEGGK